MAHRTFLCGAILFSFFFCRSAVHTSKFIIYRSYGGLSLLVEPTIDCLPTAYYFKFMFSFHFYLMQLFSAVATILKEKKIPPKTFKNCHQKYLCILEKDRVASLFLKSQNIGGPTLTPWGFSVTIFDFTGA